jgi:hypothetical protein
MQSFVVPRVIAPAGTTTNKVVEHCSIELFLPRSTGIRSQHFFQKILFGGCCFMVGEFSLIKRSFGKAH